LGDLHHVNKLKKGRIAWNRWREEHPDLEPNLRYESLGRFDFRGIDLRRVDFENAELSSAIFGVNLRGSETRREDLPRPSSKRKRSFLDTMKDARWGTPAALEHADLTETYLLGAELGAVTLDEATLWRANLKEAKLFRASLHRSDLSEAILTKADLQEAKLTEADLRGACLDFADLRGANLQGANLSGAKLVGAKLGGAVLERAVLVGTNVTGADLTGCRVYGISTWALELSEDTRQQDLVITEEGEPEITVDNIEVAQFLYMLLRNKKIRSVIDTITSKVVLILGRFTPERKAVLDALRDELRKPGRNYVPIVFDFEKPRSQTTVETVTLLARMARFVIADISDAKTVLQELQAIVPDLPSVAVQPVLLRPQEEPGMFDFFRRYPWFLKVHRYDSPGQLLTDLGDRVIRPAEAKVLELRGAPM